MIGCLILTSQAQPAASKLPSAGRSQTNAPRFGTISSRFLVIVETSRAMGHRSDATTKAVGSLLYSGFNHQIKQGDTLGIWTYNQQLYAGRVPLRRWSAPLQHEIVSDTVDFLKTQKYQKQPAFSSIRPALDKVIKDSEFITIVLISSGEDAISGTPFDDKINELYKNWKLDQEKAKMPFITVLRAKRGTVTGYAAVPVPWQVEIPAWPAEPVITNAAPPAVAISPPKVQPAPVQALIFTGKKSKPAETTNSSEAVSTTPESASPTPTAASTTAAIAPAVAEPPHAISERPPTTAAPDTTVIEGKVRQSEAPQRASDPALSTPLPLSPIAKSETPSSLLANNSNASNPAPAETGQKSTPPPQDVSAGLAIPTNTLLSNKIIWLAALAVLGITCAILIALSRRPRSEHISLITHSLEHENK